MRRRRSGGTSLVLTLKPRHRNIVFDLNTSTPNYINTPKIENISTTPESQHIQ